MVAASQCLAFALFAGLLCGPGTAQSADNGFLFFDSDTQSRFARALTTAGVPFQVRGDGYILYRSFDEGRVSQIRLAVLKDSYTPTYHFYEKHREQLFLDRLAAERIDFGVNLKDGERWIAWPERDDARVESIRRSILDAK